MGLGKYMVTELHKNSEKMPVNYFTDENISNNSNLSTIEQVMSAGCSLVNDYDEYTYVEKVELGYTICPYVQVPETDFGKKGKQKGSVLHAPLYKEGSWI